MSVKTDSTGRRFVSVEAEVPGTPEEVWQAIATGPGVSAWFVPTEIEERAGGRIVSHFGPGADVIATVTEWEPPRRLAAQSEVAPDAPPFATEWIVEARTGGTCIVRVVHSLFTERDSWDDQLEGAESGWPSFFRVLKLYLQHYAGERATSVQSMAMSPNGMSAAWERLLRELGSTALDSGSRVRTAVATPPIAGVVEHHSVPEGSRALVLRIDAPAPGIMLFGAHQAGPQVCMVMSGYLYGEQGAAAAQAAQWQPWFDATVTGAGR